MEDSSWETKEDSNRWDEGTRNYYGTKQMELFDGGPYYQCAECGDKNFHTECGNS